MTLAYFKRGDPLSLDMWLYDATVGLTIDPDDITRGIEFVGDEPAISCYICTIQGKRIGELGVEPHVDQVTHKGKFTLLSLEPTDTWPVGKAIFDVKISILGQVKHSMSFTFEIVETYTP